MFNKITYFFSIEKYYCKKNLDFVFLLPYNVSRDTLTAPMVSAWFKNNFYKNI